MGFRVCILMERNHAGDVNLVADKIIPVERLVVFVPKLQQNRLPPAKPLGEG